MGLLQKMIGSQKTKHSLNENAYNEFWQWFQQHQQDFYHIVAHGNASEIEQDFFDRLAPELEKVNEGIFFLTGMLDSQTAELILTPGGIIKNIVFVEELIAVAPEIAGWKFTALKPESDIDRVGVNMHGYEFSQDTLSFYFNDLDGCSDEFELIVLHDAYNEAEKDEFLQAIYIFLDNYLGEYVAVTKLDQVSVQSTQNAKKTALSIGHLKNILILKNSEISRLDKIIHLNTDEDEYVSLSGETQQGLPIMATLNSTLLNWSDKGSHPWMMLIDITYNGHDSNGMPSSTDYEMLDVFEEELMQELKDSDGYLNIGRETGVNLRTIYMACKDFRQPSKVMKLMKQKYEKKFEIELSLFKDKSWHCLKKFG